MGARNESLFNLKDKIVDVFDWKKSSDDIHLPNAPLVRVLAQVRFPLIASIEEQRFIAPFQEKIRKSYPTVAPEKSIVVNVAQQPSSSTNKKEIMWRFFDASQKWRVTLATRFLALETSEYTTQANLLDRLKTLCSCLKETLEPTGYDRLGLRYINQVKSPHFINIKELVRPEVLGVAAILPGIVQSVGHTLMSADDTGLLSARWGHLPEWHTYDPSNLSPINEKSWVLDLDMYDETKRQNFTPDDIIKRYAKMGDGIHAFFRWVVTKKFLETYGGNV